MAIRLFGTTIEETIRYFMGATAGNRPSGPKKKTEPKAEQDVTPPAPSPSGLSDERLKIWGRLVLSVLTVVGAFLMLNLGHSESQKVGAGFIGVVLGYWLR
jgi:hypothetical protein